MKMGRLLAYGVAGIISGLLLENKALIFKQKAKTKAGKIKKQASKALSK